MLFGLRLRFLEVRHIDVRGDKPGDFTAITNHRRLVDGEMAHFAVAHAASPGVRTYARIDNHVLFHFDSRAGRITHLVGCGRAQHLVAISAKFALVSGIHTHKAVLAILHRHRVRHRIKQQLRKTQRFAQLAIRQFACGDITRDALVSGKLPVRVKHRFAVDAHVDPIAVMSPIIHLEIPKRRVTIQHLVVGYPLGRRWVVAKSFRTGFAEKETAIPARHVGNTARDDGIAVASILLPIPLGRNTHQPAKAQVRGLPLKLGLFDIGGNRVQQWL